ncbi:hypothetical protein P7L68_00770 (plasmid) [Tistrella mobilis]|uniref:hypothetical protein n=1 Tax=Tistrella mobilis TaxID=171437 RepID=UPI0035581F29
MIDRLLGPRGPHPNRVSPEGESAVLDDALAHPCHGSLRVAQELAKRNIRVSSGGVRGVWQRHNLLTRHDRLLCREKSTAERRLTLSDEHIRVEGHRIWFDTIEEMQVVLDQNLVIHNT